MALDGDDRGIIVRPSARARMAAHRPTVWLVLLDVALDADWHDGRLVAPTSARLVAEHLRLDPGTAASALRTLRDAGLVELDQASGSDGRFGLAAYTVHLPDGIETLAPQQGAPCADEPRTANPDTVGHHAGLVLSCPWDGSSEPSASALPTAGGTWAPPKTATLIANAAEAARPSRRRRTAAKRPAEQGAFDLGDGA